MSRWTPLVALCLAFLPLAGRGVAAPADVSVMSFNIRYGTAEDGPDAWPRRRELVFDVIRRHDPDVVGVQEALRFQLDELREALPGYRRIGVGRADGRSGGEHAAILYRADRFRAEEHGTFWLSSTPDVPGSRSWGNRVTRIATWARLHDRRSRQVLLVYNVHLDHQSQPSRVKSVELLMSRIAARARAGDAVIVTGDFNAGEDNPIIAAMKTRFVDSYRVVHPDEPRAGTFGAFTGRRTGPKIDYVFVGPDATVLDAAIVYDHQPPDPEGDPGRKAGRYPSDHFPVTARLRLPDRPAERERKEQEHDGSGLPPDRDRTGLAVRERRGPDRRGRRAP